LVNFIALFAIIVAVALFVRLSGNPLNHSPAYLKRRILNWVPLGVGYAFLYFARYNLNPAKIALGDLMTKHEFGTIGAAGTWTYALAFLLNGPLTDRIGGRRSMLISVIGAAASNVALGTVVFLLSSSDPTNHLRSTAGHGLLMGLFTVLYSINMYFQSFGAVSIVKVNSAWFHVRERGVFGGIFGILISAGIFFAYNFGPWIVDVLHTARDAAGKVLQVQPPFWVFWIPSLLLLATALWIFLMVRDRPREAGYSDFDTGDASSGEDDTPDPLLVVLKKVVTHPIVLTIGAIEFCTGILRQGIMQWYPIYGNEWGFRSTFVVTTQWGLMLFLAGSLGGMVAGWISDKVFGSRRGPVAALLYGLMLFAVVAMIPLVHQPVKGMTLPPTELWGLGICVIIISFCVIGTHGMLSGTATMDFGGRKNAGTAVGLIDGLVYLGTGVQFLGLGFLTEKSWTYWPIFLVPFGILGTALALRIWKAMPQAARRGGAH
jgi:OPA family glycerol-3-phosphate transporter-like MFS transporter